MISRHLLQRDIKSPPLFPEPSNMIPFELSHLSKINLQSVKAKESLYHIESTLKVFNNALDLQTKNNSHSAKGILRQYLWFRKLYDEVILTSFMNMPLKDDIINSLSQIILQKQKRQRKKQTKMKQTLLTVSQDEQKYINKLQNSYIRRDFRKSTSLYHFQKYSNQRVNTQNQKYNKRKNRLYGLQNISRKTTIQISNKDSNKSVNNNKLLWNWGIKQKCKQFSTTIQSCSLHNHIKSLKQYNKLIQQSYISKQRQFSNTQLKRKPRVNNQRVNIKQIKQIQYENFLF